MKFQTFIDLFYVASLFVLAGVFVGVISVFVAGLVMEMTIHGKVFMFLFTTLAYVIFYIVSQVRYEEH